MNKISSQEYKVVPNYDYGKGYMVVNLDVIPWHISDSDYGKFCKLNINHENKVAYPNGKPIKKKDLAISLGYGSIDALNKYLKRLSRQNLIREYKIGGVRYLIVNPIYVTRSSFTLTQQFIDLFGEDLIPTLYNTIKDLDLLIKYKRLIPHLKYQKMEFELNSGKHYRVTSEKSKWKGIYLLYQSDEVVYIGKSLSNMANRISNHKRDKEFDEVKCVEFKNNADINLYEPYLINRYKPKYNRDLVGGMVGIYLPEIKGI